MVKNWQLFILALFVTHASSAQVKLDLEKLTFNEDPRELAKGRRKTADSLEPLSTLPAYTVYGIDVYHFGPVMLEEDCYTQLLLNSIKEKKLVGVVIGFETTATSKAIHKYVFSKYPKPVVLEQETVKRNNKNKPYLSPSAYLWRNIRPGITMLMSKGFHTENGVPVETTDLVLIQNNAKPAYQTGFKTVLDRIIKTYKP
jgi:hypothetical protein